MPNDLQIAEILQQLYDGVLDSFTYTDTISGVSFGVVVRDDCVIVCFEGTHDKPDVDHDFEAELIRPPELNGAGVHAGGWAGLDDAMDFIRPYIPMGKPIIICGHSLGALRVNLAAGLLMHYGYDPKLIQRVKIASPRSNDYILENMLKDSPLSSWWNYRFEVEHDPVCDVPFRCSVLGLPYFTGEKKKFVDSPPGFLDPWGVIIGWHHLSLYIKGMALLPEFQQGATS
jgi:hypothetical protein